MTKKTAKHVHEVCRRKLRTALKTAAEDTELEGGSFVWEWGGFPAHVPSMSYQGSTLCDLWWTLWTMAYIYGAS